MEVVSLSENIKSWLISHKCERACERRLNLAMSVSQRHTPSLPGSDNVLAPKLRVNRVSVAPYVTRSWALYLLRVTKGIINSLIIGASICNQVFVSYQYNS